jgi:hypothetical protein
MVGHQERGLARWCKFHMQHFEGHAVPIVLLGYKGILRGVCLTRGLPDKVREMAAKCLPKGHVARLIDRFGVVAQWLRDAECVDGCSTWDYPPALQVGLGPCTGVDSFCQQSSHYKVEVDFGSRRLLGGFALDGHAAHGTGEYFDRYTLGTDLTRLGLVWVRRISLIEPDVVYPVCVRSVDKDEYGIAIRVAHVHSARSGSLRHCCRVIEY